MPRYSRTNKYIPNRNRDRALGHVGGSFSPLSHLIHIGTKTHKGTCKFVRGLGRQSWSALLLAVGNVRAHLLDVILSSRRVHGCVHVDIENVLGNNLREESKLCERDECWGRLIRRTSSRSRLCSSLTMKIISNRDKIVV